MALAGLSLIVSQTTLVTELNESSLDPACQALCQLMPVSPQESVLGPLLFLIYINDIADSLLSLTRLLADDSIVLFYLLHSRS